MIDELQQGVVMRQVFAFAVVLLVGCGGDGGVNIDSNADNVCGEIAEVGCHNLYQCCAEGEIENFLGVSEPRTELQCRDDLERICERRAGTLEFSIGEGRVRFDAAAMNACLETIVAPDDTCATVVTMLPWTEACMNTAFVGTVATGGDCFFAHDCAGGVDAFCAPNQKCAMRPTAGMPCGSGCASAFFCQTGVCAPRVAAGSMCTSTTQCQQTLFCDTSAPTPVCTARLPGGSACTSSSGCASGQCVPGTCTGTSNTCFRDTDCSGRCADDNSFCTTAANCALGTCSVSLTSCSQQSQCTMVGDVCNFPVQCLPGDCLGDPVCTAATLTVDYCTGALNELPLL